MVITTENNRQESDLTNIFEKLEYISPKAIQQQVDSVEAEKLNDFIHLNQVEDYINIYCNKTGQLIREFNQDELIQLVKIHGEKRAKSYLARQSITYISPHWIYTDTEALNNLSLFDPIGYFVYAVFLTLPQTRLPEKGSKSFDMAPYKIEELQQRIALYNQAKTFNTHDLIKTNEYLRRYLSIIDTLKARKIISFTTGTPASFLKNSNDLNNFNDCLNDNIRAVIKHEYFNGGIQTITYDLALTIKTNYSGMAAFRSQKRLVAMTSVDEILLNMKDILTEDQIQKPWIAAAMARKIEPMPKKKTLFELPDGFDLQMQDIAEEEKQAEIKPKEQDKETHEDFNSFLKGFGK